MPSDPLSVDCGGDCWGCVGETEAQLGDTISIKKYNAEIDAGLRVGIKIEPKQDDKHGYEQEELE